jgi:hypothetical protein
MPQDTTLSLTKEESDALFDLQGAEFEAMAELGNLEMKKKALIERAEAFREARIKAECLMVSSRGLDPSVFTPDLETNEIVASSREMSLMDLVGATPNTGEAQQATEDKEADLERQRGGAVVGAWTPGNDSEGEVDEEA